MIMSEINLSNFIAGIIVAIVSPITYLSWIPLTFCLAFIVWKMKKLCLKKMLAASVLTFVCTVYIVTLILLWFTFIM